MICRKLTVGDAKKTADLHFLSFKGFFLTSLGISFLQVFYKSIFSHTNSLALGLFDGEELVAFAVGTKNKSGFYSDLLRGNAISLGISAFPNLIAKPSLFFRLLKSLKSNHKFSMDLDKSATLLSICVSPLKESKGLGKKVLIEFENLAFHYNSVISLTTDHDRNEYANTFYKKNHYQLYDVFLQDKRKMNIYIKRRN